MEFSLPSLSSCSFPKPRPTRICPPNTHVPPSRSKRIVLHIKPPKRRTRLNSVQAQPNASAEPEPEPEPEPQIPDKNADRSSVSGLESPDDTELREIKEAIKGAKKEKEGDLSLSGVAEEIREIEWPIFGRVLGTTGVVLAVIAGSSVVLLTVNAVLAELSDRVFAGKGVQDFFG